MITPSRRALLTGSALAVAATVLPSRAKVPAPKMQGPGVYRYNLGAYQLTTLFDGVWYLPIDDTFVRNASGAEVNQALAAAFLPPSMSPDIVHRTPGEHRRKAGANRHRDRRPSR